MLVLGKSKCCLCKQVLENSDKIKGFSAFLPYDHKYGKFSDAAMHESCFLNDPDHKAVDDMFFVFNKILTSRPRNLKTIEEMDAWTREAFQDWPPKNGVVIYEQVFTEDGSEAEWFWSDKDIWEEFEKVEQEEQDKIKAGQEEAHRHDMEMLRYTRDDG